MAYFTSYVFYQHLFISRKSFPLGSKIFYGPYAFLPSQLAVSKRCQCSRSCCWPRNHFPWLTLRTLLQLAFVSPICFSRLLQISPGPRGLPKNFRVLLGWEFLQPFVSSNDQCQRSEGNFVWCLMEWVAHSSRILLTQLFVIFCRVPTLLLTKKSRTFQDPMKNFPGPFQSPRMF